MKFNVNRDDVRSSLPEHTDRAGASRQTDKSSDHTEEAPISLGSEGQDLNSLATRNRDTPTRRSADPQTSPDDERTRQRLSDRKTDEDDEPWPEPVDGMEILDQVFSMIVDHVALERLAAVAVTLWVVHTYVIDALDVSPLLAVLSPEKRCGKTTLLRLLRILVRRPAFASNITPAAMFRTIDSRTPTLLIDEADTFLDSRSEIRNILNAGHTRSTAFVYRCEVENFEPRRFATFCPKVIAQIGSLPGTIVDRAICVLMVRKDATDRISKFRDSQMIAQSLPLRQQLVRWTNDVTSEVANREPLIPEQLHDRAQDNWRPLLAIADVAGGDWPRLTRQAAVHLSEIQDSDDDSPSIQLLKDIRTVFSELGHERVRSQQLVTQLAKLAERPWRDWSKGKALTQRDLATLLAHHRIRPLQLRFGDQTARGYEREAFEDAWRRYLPDDSQFRS